MGPGAQYWLCGFDSFLGALIPQALILATDGGAPAPAAGGCGTRARTGGGVNGGASGRRARPTWARRGPHDDRVFHTERLAVNFVMQGSNAAITKAAR
jgi:hypothetical protein